MSAPIPTVVDFLRARLDEDEATARAVIESDHSEGRWKWDTYTPTPADKATLVNERGYPLVRTRSDGPTWMVCGHIARHDPARVLREVEAKRAILDHAEELRGRVMAYRSPRWKDAMNDGDKHEWHKAEARYATAEHALRSLASAYSDHPDYEWKDCDERL